jgi:hypothetical protein
MLSKLQGEVRMVVGFAVLCITGFLAILGILIQMSRSSVALGFSLIFVIGGAILLAYAVGMKPGAGVGMLLYFSCIIPLLRAFPALQALDRYEADQRVAAARHMAPKGLPGHPRPK